MKAFSVASWNVKHFKQDPKRVPRVIAFLNARDPDVFALYEVQGKEVFNELVKSMPGYSFHITEGKEVQEILVGVRQGLTSFFTQKTEFQSGVTEMRPGALLTVTVNGQNYPILFLHVASADTPRGLGLRDDMLIRACDFREVLDKAAGGNGKANYIFAGDFNLMGMDYKYVKGHNIAPADEIQKLGVEAGKIKMRILAKDAPNTWWSGSSSLPQSNLDQVVAADHLQFTKFGDAEVTVLGWPKEQAAGVKKWIQDYSDHAMLYFEVQG